LLRLPDQAQCRPARRDDDPAYVGELDPVQRGRICRHPRGTRRSNQRRAELGTIRTGVTLSASQVQELYNAIGVDVSQPLNASGYYLDIKDAAPSTRVARQS